MNNRKYIVKMKFGSDLYGTVTSASDTDYKGVFIPSKKEIFLDHIPKSLKFDTKSKHADRKNNSTDVDEEYYSLHYFVKLACEGQTVALDMLHAPENMVETTSDIWRDLQSNRHLFYTKNLQAFIGYSRRQAAKYGIKGSRIAAVKKVLNFLEETLNNHSIPLISSGNVRLNYIWDKLPRDLEHIHFMKDPKTPKIRLYQVCGKCFQETARITYVYDILLKFFNSYGERAKQAEKNENIDWKAVSHALRAAYELKSLYKNGTIIFPLPEASFLTKVKLGFLSWNEKISNLLDDLINEVEQLAANSRYPSHVNYKFWENWLYETIRGEIEK